MSKRICLITGATSGIGKATAYELSKKNYELILIGRNEEKCKKVVNELNRKNTSSDVKYYVTDISLIKEVKKLCERLKNDYQRIDVLINNAGARFLQHQLTSEGIELTLATNHLGHFVLTNELLPLLKNSDDARIINVSSAAHGGGKGLIENISDSSSYDGRLQYSNSKLANVLFTYELAERLSNHKIGVFAVDPGGVATNFARNNGLKFWIKHLVYYLLKRQLITPKQAAQTIVYLANSIEVKGQTAKYFFDMKEKKSSQLSYDKSLQKNLWEMSEELVKGIK
ncbi:Dehydrogenase [Ignavibacterium album JCM 16511]|uniref:Dehydrogenase n=1 Tax=Ignavibacterium album (strain DSM 19864 / JCM 16511 / NBRC 101810 / Mat9-16) TaxID=945713 RepID=I0AG87_IGNAJ|nr:SDR family oxidoreductase [Ignavibacterium album]AFH47994.1 Dehydrogenase [Ignavibacterium album JCM 16511]